MAGSGWLDFVGSLENICSAKPVTATRHRLPGYGGQLSGDEIQWLFGSFVHTRAIQASSPLTGRPVANGKRELVIGRRAHGYLALYRYLGEVDTVFVLAVRSQREAGYAGDDRLR